MEREACVCDHGFERSDLCAEIIIIIILYGEHDIHKQLPNNRLCSLFFFFFGDVTFSEYFLYRVPLPFSLCMEMRVHLYVFSSSGKI